MKQEFTIKSSHVGLLYEDGVFIETLPPGRHIFKTPMFKRPVFRQVVQVDRQGGKLYLGIGPKGRLSMNVR